METVGLKTIGLIGGRSWEDTRAYLDAVNRAVLDLAGAGHSARIVLKTFDAAHLALLESQGKSALVGEKLVAAARDLERCGAGVVAYCGLLRRAEQGRLESALKVPLIDGWDALRAAVTASGLSPVGVLGGDRWSCSELEELLGARVLVPQPCHAAGLASIGELVCRGARLLVVESERLGVIAGAAAPGVRVLSGPAAHARAIAEHAAGQAIAEHAAGRGGERI